MEEILNSLELSHLIQTFSMEKIMPNDVVNLTDQELCSLGVNLLGDRIRLKNSCKDYVDHKTEASSSASLSSGRISSSATQRAVARERAMLFSPYARPVVNNSRRGRAGAPNYGDKRKRGRTWTVTFVCLFG